MRSTITYHGHIATVCLFDAEWSRLPSSDRYEAPYQSVEKQVRETCDDYRGEILAALREFEKTKESRGANSASSWCADAGNAMPSYLFRPLCYIPLGHADLLAIVLMDDFDPLQRITTRVRTAVEGIDLCFCPTKSSLQESSDSNRCCGLEELLRDDPVCGPPRDPHAFLQQPFQQDLPLLVYTKYKLDWWGTVGYAILFEQALLKAIAKKTEEVLDDLLRRYSPDDTGLMKQEDIRSLRYAVMDLQGEEEMATLIFCRNYSAAFSVVSALRSLTLGDLLDADEDHSLLNALLNSEAHEAVLKLYRTTTKQSRPLTVNELRGNHVFRWTNSLLAVSPDAMFDENATNCNGFVEATGCFRVASGHQVLAEQAMVCTAAEDDQTESLGTFDRYHVGTADLMMPFVPARTGGRAQQSLISLKSLLSIIRANRKTFSASPDSANHEGRDVVDFTTAVTVPVPKRPPAFQRETHRPVLLTVLPVLQESLCFGRDNKDRAAVMEQREIAPLRECIAKVGLPVELQRTILLLYHDFANFLADPFLFDSVLDLYDVFATLHATLTSHLPKQRGLELARSSKDWLDPLDATRIEQLSMLASALHNALRHRVARMYPESPVRDIAVDFRGGLTQIVLAANAPLMCGLGLLRKYVLGVGPLGSPRNTVGGLTAVDINPGTRSVWIELDVERYAQLAIIEADVPHVLHPPSYADYLHECGHLIFQSLGAQQILSLSMGSIPTRVMEERVHEIFANLLTFLILFAGDSDTFLFNQVLSYAKSRSSRSADKTDNIAQFSELIIRLFMVADTVEPGTPRKSWLETLWRRIGAQKADVMDAFKKTLQKVAPFLPDYARLWNGADSPGQEYCLRQFEWIFPEIAVYMGDIWAHAIYVFREFYTRDLLRGTETPDPQLSIYDEIDDALKEGRPLVRCLYQRPYPNCTRTDTDRDGFDALALGYAMLYRYMSRIKNAADMEVHLRRDPHTGKIVYQGHEREWFPFQVEQGAAAMFSPVPAERCARLKREISILKTFWDIAANLKARRLKDIVVDTLRGNGISPAPESKRAAAKEGA